MIEGVGYTKDGLVFISIKAENDEGLPGTVTLTMTPDIARTTSECLKRAADEVDSKRTLQ